MSGLKRFVNILHLFHQGKSDWTVPDISEALNVPASTIYRSVRELVSAGFLEPSTEAHYRLGASFVEFDRLIRLTDPLVRLGQPLLQDVAEQAQIPCIVMLARLYDNRVMCVADSRPRNSTVKTSYERGLPRPLTRGATSKVILAQLPARRLSRLIAREKQSGLGPALPKPEEEFRAELGAIRKRGYSIARGEVDPGMAGIAAPVAVPELAISASLSIVVNASDLDAASERRLTLLVVSSASLLTETMKQELPLGTTA